MISSKFNSDSLGTLFYIRCCGKSLCFEDVMSDVGFTELLHLITEYESVGEFLCGSLVLLIFLESGQTSIDVGS